MEFHRHIHVILLDKTSYSEHIREHGSSVLWIIVTELLSVLGVLLLGPNHHGTGTNDQEEVGGPVVDHDGKDEPRERLKHVVWERNQLKGKASWDLVFSGPVGSQLLQQSVAVEVAELEENHQSAEKLQLVVGSVSDMEHPLPDPGVVDVLRRVDGKPNEHTVDDPVVGGVSEEERKRHGVSRERVHKQGLVLSLEVVE